VSCHGENGQGGQTIVLTDNDADPPVTQTINFDLRGGPVTYGFGDAILTGYSRSHLSLLGPDMLELDDLGANVTVEVVGGGEIITYVEPASARDSRLIQKLNPPQLYPAVNTDVRFDPAAPVHPVDVGGVELTPDEYYVLILMADMGGQFYSRENAPGTGN
jgi:hypothetical protein